MNRYKLILFILIFYLTCSFTHAQYLSNLTLKNNITDTVKSAQTLTEKSPFLAGTQSFIVPGFGFGQLYNEQPIKCLIHSAISIPCIILAVVSLPHTNIVEPGTGNGPFLISFSVFTINWIWSIVDAVISANKINSQVRLQKNNSDIFDKINFGLTVDKNKQLNLKFAFEL